MEPRHIVRMTAVAALGWVGIIAVGLVRGSSGPAPDPTQLLLQLVVGPAALLALGNGLAWLLERMSGEDLAGGRAPSGASGPIAGPGAAEPHRA